MGGPVPVIMTREVTITKLMGCGEEASRAKQFKDDIERAWEATPGMSANRRLALIRNNVGPIVKDEIDCQESDDPVVVLNDIVKVFGERRSPVQLRDVLRGVRQYPGEQVRLYSHRVKSAFKALTERQKALGVAADGESTLVEQFVCGLQCPTLSRFLEEKRETTDVKDFLGLREIAIRWARDEAPSVVEPVAATASLQAVETPREDRLDRLEKIVGEQSKQLSDITSSLSRLLEAQSTANAQRKPYKLGYDKNGRDKNGRRVCYRCKSTEHMVADCPVPSPTGNFQPPQ